MGNQILTRLWHWLAYINISVFQKLGKRKSHKDCSGPDGPDTLEERVMRLPCHPSEIEQVLAELINRFYLDLDSPLFNDESFPNASNFWRVYDSASGVSTTKNKKKRVLLNFLISDRRKTLDFGRPQPLVFVFLHFWWIFDQQLA